MTILISTLATVCFSFACGIFLTLSYIEKPVWPMMRDPMTSRISDDVARTIHATLNRLIRLLPPTMMITMGAGLVFLLLQAWQRGFAWVTLIVLAVLVVGLGYILSQLFSRIDAVKNYPADGDISVVRDGLGKLAAIHHVGLLTAATIVVLQLALIFATAVAG
ncbi:hypothetical protein [Roseibium salinum]|uniref:Integral membrane protein DUF2269 n=1 Tax=Roseibium salinum TaxID=1604349 RepID=A0ABT3R243_9HYPH|nr:hypothetical protein [Roseibium sp. DSM 29163]MCX2723037.1 hypothetical protein [Roseibium sp. DSM 29163]MDN3719027.1 hypothetical protein [Roseibium salinum]